MAPTEDSNSETAVDTLSPAAEKRNSLNNKFRAQYHKLHRSKSLTGNVESLRSRFEEVQVDTEEKQGPKPKISLVNKSDFKVEVKSEVEEDKSIPIPKKRLSKVPVAVPVPENKQVEEKPKEPLKKSVSIEVDSVKEEKKEKRVSFSFESKNDSPPVPKPRVSLPITQVIVETTVIEPEKVSQVETVIINEPPTPINLDQIDFAAPEDRHLVTRYDDFEVGSVENIKRALDVFTMEPKKKRSPSFRSKLMTIFSKDKDKKPKDKEDTKKTKKTENAVFADNAQNENFNRHSTQRHTIDTPRRDPKSLPANHQQSFHDAMHPDQRMDLEHRYAAMHIQNFQQARNSFEAHQNQQQLMRKLPPDHGVYNPNEDYVCMDNKNDSKNYINVPKYDSSSTNTIESENSTTSVNPLQQLQQERLAIRSKFFNETVTPPRAQETNQNVQLIHPKAAIPINSERPLPNPFQQSQPSPQQRNESPYQLQQQPQRLQDENDLADSGYGTVYDRNSRPMSAGSSDISAGSMNGPRSPSVERTKLRLPQNREKVELQPRLRSPIPPSEVSTDKLIATELLKTNKKNDKKDRSSPSHQKLQLEIDYPELHETICDVVDQSSTNQNQNELSITSFNKNDVSSSSFNVTDNNTNGNMTDNEISRSTLLEAGDWHRVQRDLASSPSLKNVQITTNALVHVDSPHRANTPSQDGRSRSITPNMMVRRNSNTSLQRSPPKQEIRQNVEAFCWKELKKLKEQEEQQMQRLVGPMISSCGYAEDPIRRSRSMAVTPRDTRRSSSLPREIRQRRVDDFELNARRIAQQQRFNTGPQRGGDGQTRPIFNRGSLTHQNAIDQPIYSKKVSFRSHNTQNNTAWPTKNGFTQSPPQRRLDADSNGVTGRESLEDDVFLPPEGGPPSRDEIFLLNQQRQKELLLAKAQRSNAPVSTIDSGTASVVDSASVISEVPPMRTIREPIYAARPPMQSQIPNKVMNENIYGSRGPHNEPIYGSRNGGMPRINEGAYNGNMVRNEEPYGTRQANESIYGSRPSHNEPIYTSRPAPPASRSMSESPYGSRMYPNGMPQRDESIYGSKSSNMVPESVYSTRGSVQREPIYGSRQIQPPRMESPYGTMQNGQRYLPGYPPPGHQEPVYGSRPHLQAHPHFHPQNTEEIYGYRRGSGSVRSESPYGARPPIPNQQYYNRPRLSPSSIGPPLPPGGPGRGTMLPGLKRSNSLRQPVSPESLYGGRPNFNKPPSGVQYRQRQIDLSPPGQRYDLPPGDSLPRQQEPIYGTGTRKINTVNNKVCDIYGNIYDANKQTPLSPPPLQKAGVLYGQLQRNSNAQPVAYQSHQQLQPNNNFQRGTRLTASVNDMHRYNSNGNMGQITQRTEPPSRPLPPIPDEQQKKLRFGFGRKNKNESGKEEEWNSDGKRGGLSGSESGGRSDTDGDLRSRSRNNRRDDPRRHTLAGEQYGTMSGQGGPLSRTMDLEGQPRGYPPPSNAMLFDDDPGIMSEVETSSTGFRRGGKQRSSLPVVRTPSKTLERPLGLVFLQYRNETKRALLPNEITSIDTVKALFVRSFPKQLTMEYLDSPQVKIYIHDSSKDMFYELEDLRSHLREIRDRSVLRLFESADVTGGLPMAGIGIAGGAGVPHFEDPSYFSEPEFDSEYQHQHIHKSKGSAKGAPYYIGSTASLPRAGLLRAYSPAVGNLPQDRMKTLPTDGYMSSPERGSRYEEAYYSQYGARSGSITPVIDEEVSDTELIDDQYSIYGVKIAPGGPRPAPRTQFSTPAAPPYDATRIRVEHMERQLANLTGLVQKALTHQTPATLQVPSTGRDSYRDKSVSFEKSVSFSDEPPDMNSPKQHSPQHSGKYKTRPAVRQE